ncbi:hypothetical protein OG978_01345 [Streptomyces sp. NBC_01591]|uniref:hypothetical protein n=1 Tax=Streptomyces sp. NBC_01591 TaxID=2975888 RepID=UPI002DDAA716|nr:hypothetical protein [Streptomyces sp. NBC_01591]WSD66197.1 hypothetical protein OG978_01345 [Streptomyces sp. NBC_01591]
MLRARYMHGRCMDRVSRAWKRRCTWGCSAVCSGSGDAELLASFEGKLLTVLLDGFVLTANPSEVNALSEMLDTCNT